MKKVTEIIEIVFEKVQIEKVIGLLMKLLSNSTLKDYNVASEKPDLKLNFQSKEILFNNIQSLGDSFYFNFLNLKLEGLLLSKIGFQIDKYDDNYDLNLHIEEREITQEISISLFQSWAESLAEELDAQDYFCGYEPAVDEETRFFSGSKLGPLKAWGNSHQ